MHASFPDQVQKHLLNTIARKCVELHRCSKNHGTSLATSTDEMLDDVQKQILITRKLLNSERDRIIRERDEFRETFACKFREAINAVGLSQKSARLRVNGCSGTSSVARYTGAMSGSVVKPGNYGKRHKRCNGH